MMFRTSAWLTVTTPDALDFYGYWKLFDALSDAAFYGRNREFALGNTPDYCYMGTWSDGRPVRTQTPRFRPAISRQQRVLRARGGAVVMP